MISEDVCPICNYDNSAKPIKTDDVADSASTKKDTMICPICKFEQPKGRKVCWHCGVNLESNN
jgi:predicted amidophosphoribosyltransferase